MRRDVVHGPGVFVSGHANSLKPILLAFGANFAIFVAKLVAALLTGSGAMLAEAIHSLADCGNQLLLLFGLRSARGAATTEHPLGRGKAVYFWSFLVALLLFSAGGMFSLREGVHKLSDPEPLRWPWIAVGVLVFAIIAEGVSLHGCLAEVAKVRAGRSLWRWFRESRQSELIVIFGEDIAALAGLVLALLAVVVSVLTGNPLFDAIGTLAIGVLLVVISVFLAIEVKALLIGQSAEPEVEQRIRGFLETRPEVTRVLHLITLQLGPDVMLAAKVEMAPVPDWQRGIDAINAVERDLKAAVPSVRWSFFEPDVSD